MQISDHIIDSTHTSSHTSVNSTGQILLLIWSVSQHLKKPKRRIKISYESLLQEIMIFATAIIITICSPKLFSDVMRIRPTIVHLLCCAQKCYSLNTKSQQFVNHNTYFLLLTENEQLASMWVEKHTKLLSS